MPVSGLTDGPDASPAASGSPAADASPADSSTGDDPSVSELGSDAISPRDDAAPTNGEAGGSDSFSEYTDVAAAEAQQGGMVDGAPDDARVGVDAGKVAYVQIATATPPGFVQSASANFPRSQSAGDLNVIVVGWGDSTDSLMQVSDTAGNAYDLAIGPTHTTGASQSIYYAKNISAAAANTVHVQFKLAVARLDLRVVEYAELDTVAPLDAVAWQSGFGGTPTSGPAATHTASEIIFGAGTTTDSFSNPGLHFTLRVLTADGDIVEDRPVGSVGEYAADGVLTNGTDWVMQVVTFRRR